MPPAKILVTGCAGYVGSMVTHELLHRGFQVRGYDSLRFGGNALLGFFANPDFQFVHGDVRDGAKIRQHIGDCDGVVHLAAIVGDPACARDPELAKEINQDASFDILDAATEAGIKRLIFASTCSNYGKMPDADSYVNETSELQPVSLYAETKVAVEKEILSRQSDTSPCYTCLRFATVYGASPRMRFDLTVNQFAMEMVTLKKLVVYGEQFWRPYIHVRDMARGVGEVLTAPVETVQGQVFNVGSTEENYTKQMIVDIINEEIPGGEVEFVHKDEDPRDYRVAFEKIKETLGFSISRTVREGIREVAQLIQDGIIEDPQLAIYGN